MLSLRLFLNTQMEEHRKLLRREMGMLGLHHTRYFKGCFTLEMMQNNYAAQFYVRAILWLSL